MKSYERLAPPCMNLHCHVYLICRSTQMRVPTDTTGGSYYLSPDDEDEISDFISALLGLSRFGHACGVAHSKSILLQETVTPSRPYRNDTLADQYLRA